MILGFWTPVASATVCGPSLGEVPLGVSLERTLDGGGRLLKIRFVDQADPSFFASAEIWNGDLLLSITARRADKRSRALYGRDVLRIAMHEFGDRVRAVRGGWQSGDNWNAYHEGLRDGLDPKLAAAGTWTGRAAARAGFTIVTEPAMRSIGPDGTLRFVDVRFERPHAGAPAAGR